MENSDIATVTSMLSFFRSMGGVANVAIGGSMINNVLTHQQVDPNNFMDVYAHPDKYAMATQAVFRQCKRDVRLSVTLGRAQESDYVSLTLCC